MNTSYQKRWFSLKGNLLFYRERRSERDLLGVIVLERCTVQLCDSEEHFAFSVSFYGDAEEVDGLRTYKFSAEDQASQESWVKALHSAHHGYLELLVQDLRQQYLGEARHTSCYIKLTRSLRFLLLQHCSRHHYYPLNPAQEQLIQHSLNPAIH